MTATGTSTTMQGMNDFLQQSSFAAGRAGPALVLLACALAIAACDRGPEQRTGPAAAPAHEMANETASETADEEGRETVDADSSGPVADPAEAKGDYDPARDYFSYSNRDGMTIRHLELDLDVDFDRQELRGSAVLHVELTDPSKVTSTTATEGAVIKRMKGASGEWVESERTGVDPEPRQSYGLTLDNRGLEVDGAWLLHADGPDEKLLFGVVDELQDSVRGAPIYVLLPQGFEPDGIFRIRVDYRTGPDASAIMWLPPELTAGGDRPFMFTQSQSIHARSWVPLQDTPAVRFTYEAVIRTPPGLRAVMSADNDPETPADGEYRFSMPQPIPSYLLALAVGDLAFSSFGDRTGVYAEPEILPAAAQEFADTQAMLEAAETLWGPYEWGRYDLLILPPSFPYGGMENPRLSFLTPSLIAGDGSLVSTVAHELAHSWSGNLVSNATWRDIWLNEGMTTYLEGRLMEVIYSRERADEERTLNYRDLIGLLETVPEAMQPLAPRFDEGDPDVGQDGVEYRKGQLLLDTLEHRFSRPVFDAFLKRYFEAFAWQAIRTEQFLDYADRHLLQTRPGAFSRAQLEAWLYQPGVPEDALVPAASSLDRAADAAVAYGRGETAADALVATGWSVVATVQFIQSLPGQMAPGRIADLDAALAFSATGNAEIARSWFTRVAQWRYRPAYAAMRDYLGRYGRIRLLRPVYAALAANGADLAWAQETFAGARANYHPLTIASIEPVIAGKEER